MAKKAKTVHRGRAIPDEERSSDLTPIFSDGPVREGPVSFGFEGVANTLADLALRRANRTPFTVVVKGGSGCGKTTLLETTRRRLEERGAKARAALDNHREVKTLWLNAWKYPQDDMILAGLLGKLLDQFRSDTRDTQLTGFVETHKHLLPLLAAAASWLPGGEMGAEASAASRFHDADKKRAFYDHFEELFGQLSYAWFHGRFLTARDNIGKTLAESSHDHVIAVFLDDLDRCPKNRVKETLEAITLFLNVPGICFYLGLDWRRVNEMLPDATGGHQVHFLQKIVQVELDLPEVTEEGAQDYLRRLVGGTSLARVVDDDAQRSVAEILSRRDPRHIKRFLNDLAIRIGVLRNTHRLEPPPSSDQHPRLDEADVLAWHLVREALPADQRTNLVKHRLNLDRFLGRYEAATKTAPGEDGPAAAGAGDEPHESGAASALNEAEARLFRHPAMRTHLDRLLALSSRQRGLLVHRGLPPRGETSVPRRAVSAVDGQWWVRVPGGSFAMGSTDGEKDERPVHPVQVRAFAMSRYPVANADYRPYVAETGAAAPRHWTNGPDSGRERDASGRPCVVARRGSLLHLAVDEARSGGAPADRSAVGVCRSWKRRAPVSVGRSGADRHARALRRQR